MPASLTILEQTHLEEFVHTTELARARYDAERPEFVEETMVIVGESDRVQDTAGVSRYDLQERASRIVRKPAWTKSMTAMEVKDAEDRAFLEWRRDLAHLEEKEGIILSPFERNVDFWRQLWRTVERSDLIVQIVDARDPLFFLSTDLFQYVSEVAEFQQREKSCLLLINKADFVSKELRQAWRDYFESCGYSFRVVFFSALRELGENEEEEEESCGDCSGGILGSHAFEESSSDIVNASELLEIFSKSLPSLSNKRYQEGITVGMVGFPNVGKSSVINALLGTKKVSASATPGKTKHLQTIELSSEITLCDCPGIVLPSAVASKAHLVVNATMPLDHLRGGVVPAVELVVERIGFKELIHFYKCQHALLPQFRRLGSDARAFLSALAVAKKYFLALNVPDESKAARVVLKDVCSGRLVHVMHPPGSSLGADLDLDIELDLCSSSPVVEDELEKLDEEQNIGLENDIADFLVSLGNDLMPRKYEKPLTKRAMRMGSKKETKSKNRFNASSSCTNEQKSLADQISMLKPGGRGRVSKALLDPYGCHPSLQL